MTDVTKPHPGITRRQMLGLMWGASMAALLGQAGVALAQYLEPRVTPGTFGTKVIAGRAKEFKVNTVSYVQQGRFYVVRLEDGGFLALWQRCTHLGCTVPWRADEKQFHCPCHGSLYNLRGEVTGGPAPRPLDLFPIEVVNNSLVIDTGHPIARERFDPGQVLHV